MFGRLVLVFVLFGISQSAFAQIGNPFARGPMPPGSAMWQEISQEQRACIDAELRRQSPPSSLGQAIVQGLGPYSNGIAEIVKGCRHDLPNPSIYAVDGLAVGAKVRPDSNVYRQYQCNQSSQFADAIWCQRQTAENGPRGSFQVSTSILHDTSATALYVNRYIQPAHFTSEEIQNQLDRLSKRYGHPTVRKLDARNGLPDAIIAIYGNIELEPLSNAQILAIKSGRRAQGFIPMDFLGDFKKSAQLGLPLFRLSGRYGYIWSASHDSTGLGHIRFLAANPILFDPNASSHLTTSPHLQPNSGLSERQQDIDVEITQRAKEDASVAERAKLDEEAAKQKAEDDRRKAESILAEKEAALREAEKLRLRAENDAAEKAVAMQAAEEARLKAEMIAAEQKAAYQDLVRYAIVASGILLLGVLLGGAWFLQRKKELGSRPNRIVESDFDQATATDRKYTTQPKPVGDNDEEPIQPRLKSESAEASGTTGDQVKVMDGNLSKLKPPISARTFLSVWMYSVILDLVGGASSLMSLSADSSELIRYSLQTIPGLLLFYAVYYWVARKAVLGLKPWARWVLLTFLAIRLFGIFAGFKVSADLGPIVVIAFLAEIPLLGLLIYWLLERSPHLWLRVAVVEASDEPITNVLPPSTVSSASRRKRIIVSIVLLLLTTSGTIWLAMDRIPKCGDSDVTKTLKRIIAEQAIKQHSYAWMQTLAKLPGAADVEDAFDISLSNEREEDFTSSKRHCSIDLSLKINDQWVDARMVLLQQSISSELEQDQKIALGIIAISRTVTNMKGNGISTTASYSVQRTEKNDIYVQVEPLW